MKVDIKKIIADVEQAIKNGSQPKTKIDDFDWETLHEISKFGENSISSSDRFFGIPEKHAIKPYFIKLDTDGFKNKILEEMKKEAKRIICKEGYEKIDTPEERSALVEKYDDVVIDFIINKYPALALARRVLKIIIRFVMAWALFEAAKALGAFCEVSQTFEIV